ncbi:MAG: YifB family Mg chelatase-like AAA ATPase [Betaproteobacteria bacterium]
MSLAILLSRSLAGFDAPLVRVETHLGVGLPAFHIVGLADAEVRESRERVRAAILSSGFAFPSGRLTVNLSPADLPKESGRFDLPIALGLLLVSGQIAVAKPELLSTLVLAGELSLTGALVPTRGAIALGLSVARNQCGAMLILPWSNAIEASRIPALVVLGANNLREVVDYLNGHSVLQTPTYEADPMESAFVPCLSDVRGQLMARRALEVAASGGHSMLMTGTPGVGKSMLAKRIAGLLPSMSDTQALELAAINTYAGLDVGISARRPVRSPHHSASAAAVIGGGARPTPGEVSLAHHGVLFLDELPEFDRKVREALREPLENGYVCIARAKGMCKFPARFQLIATMNPCPCGWKGHPTRRCQCSEAQVLSYQSRVSGPLLDRIDLCVALIQETTNWHKHEASEPSTAVALRVRTAWDLQIARQGLLNANLPDSLLEQHCQLTQEAKYLLATIVDKQGLSARSVQRVRRVARTCADLDGCETVSRTHVSEAYRYRPTTAVQ